MFIAAPSKVITISATNKAEVEDQLRVLAEEQIDLVYGSVIRQTDAKGNVIRRYDVHISVNLEPK